MRYLGIDYGEKRIGLALSDESGKFAFAHDVILNLGHGKVIKKIKKICDENNVGKIVLGKSFDFKNEPNPIMKKIEVFKKELEKGVNLEIVYEDETLTTAEAKQALRGERARPPIANKRVKKTAGKKLVDALSAAFILKSFLDK